MKNYLLLLGVVILFAQCVPEVPVPPEDKGAFFNGVFVTHEGNFGSGNASVSFINREDNTVENNVFFKTNNFNLGDVVQSMNIHFDKAFIVVNNAQKIEVTDATTLEHETTIAGFASPRYFLGINSEKAYVSNYVYQGKTRLDIVDLNTMTISDSITDISGIEQMVISGNEVFAGGSNHPYILVINTISNTIVDTIPTGQHPSFLRKDVNGKIWAFSNGNYGAESPSLIQIDPTSRTIEKAFAFTDGGVNYTSGFTIDHTDKVLYYVHAGNIWTMNINDTVLPTSPLITAEAGQTFYGLGYDNVGQYIYVADAVDYTQAGKVYQYNQDGTLRTTFDTDILPGNFSYEGY